MRFLIFSLLLISACSSSTTSQDPAAVGDEPVAIVSAWLEAVVATDVETLGELVEPVGLTVLAGVENALRSDELVALLDEGFAPDQIRGYWRSFRDDFEAIRGVALSGLSVAPHEPLPSQPGFALVELSSENGTGRIGLRLNIDGQWEIDMVSTVGSALVGPLGQYLNSALAGENAEAIADAYRTGVIPGLGLAVDLHPENADLLFETEYIRSLVGG